MTLSINKIKKLNVLIFSINDQPYYEFFKKKIIINPRIINKKNLVLSVFKSLFELDVSKKNIKKNYFKILISQIKPQVILSTNIEVLPDYIQTIFPNLIYIKVQNNYFHDHNIPEYYSLIHSKKFDFYFVYDFFYKKIFSKKIKSNFIISGPLNSYFININKKKFFKYDIMYISEYRQNEKNIFYLDFQKSVITQLSEFCKKNKLKLLIACNASRTDKNLNICEELQFYKSNNVVASYTNKSSYKYIPNVKILFCLKSNLGIEALFAGKPVIFINHYDDYLKKLIICPYIKKNSNFSINYTNNQIKFNKLKGLINLENRQLINLFQKSLKQPHHFINKKENLSYL